MNHVKQGAIEVGADIFETVSGFISDLISPPESSESAISPSYNYEEHDNGLTIMMMNKNDERKTMILDGDGNTLQQIGENLFRFNDDINLLVT